jgi:serine protease AprX
MDLVTRLGGEITQTWPFINAFGANLTARAVLTIARRPETRWISRVDRLAGTGGGTTPERRARPGDADPPAVDAANLASSYPYVTKTVDVWNAGISGAGVTVAVVDSGIAHGNGAGALDFGDRIVAEAVFSRAASIPADKHGHGTHVAGIIAGSGQASAGRYIGIAPGATLVSLKFSGDNGSANEGDLLSALQWAYTHRQQYQIRVVNISSTANTRQSYLTSPLCAAVEQLWQAGVVVVVSAGNRGDAADAVQYPPANDPYVITVGGFDDQETPDPADDVQAKWSSRGQTQDGYYKPEILAPGSRLVSVKASDSASLIARSPSHVVDDLYFRMSGTSVAAPVVAGTAALMLEKDPHLTPDEVKFILQATARDWTGMQTHGGKLLDSYAATMYSATHELHVEMHYPRSTGAAGSGTSSRVDTTSWTSTLE